MYRELDFHPCLSLLYDQRRRSNYDTSTLLMHPISVVMGCTMPSRHDGNGCRTFRLILRCTFKYFSTEIILISALVQTPTRYTYNTLCFTLHFLTSGIKGHGFERVYPSLLSLLSSFSPRPRLHWLAARHNLACYSDIGHPLSYPTLLREYYRPNGCEAFSLPFKKAGLALLSLP